MCDDLLDQWRREFGYDITPVGGTLEQIWRERFGHLDRLRDPGLDELWVRRLRWADRICTEAFAPFDWDSYEPPDLYCKYYYDEADYEHFILPTDRHGPDPHNWRSECAKKRFARLTRTQHDRRVAQLCYRAGYEHIRLQLIPRGYARLREMEFTVGLDGTSRRYGVIVTDRLASFVERLLERAARQIWEAEGHPPDPFTTADHCEACMDVCRGRG